MSTCVSESMNVRENRMDNQEWTIHRHSHTLEMKNGIVKVTNGT